MIDAQLSWLSGSEPTQAVVRVWQAGHELLICSHTAVEASTGYVLDHALTAWPKPQSQSLKQWQRVSEIGSTSIQFIDSAGAFNLYQQALTSAGADLEGARVELLFGARDESVENLELLATQYVDKTVSVNHPEVTVKLRDAQRFAKKKIATRLPQATLAKALSSTGESEVALTVTDGFDDIIVAHDSDWFDAPDQSAGYIALSGTDESDQQVTEIIRYSGVDHARRVLTGITRGVLGTSARSWAGPSDNTQGHAVTGYFYLQGNICELVEWLLVGTGVPVDWSASMHAELVDMSSLDPAAWPDIQLLLRGQHKADVKQLLERDLLPLFGAALVVNERGQLALRHVPADVSADVPVCVLDRNNLSEFTKLNYDKSAIRPSIRLSYGTNVATGKSARHILLIDPDAASRHPDRDPLALTFQALDHIEHSEQMIRQLINGVRNWHADELLRATVTATGQDAMRLQVGDVVQIEHDRWPEWRQSGMLNRQARVMSTQPNISAAEITLELVMPTALASSADSLETATAEITHPNKIALETVLAAQVPGKYDVSGDVITIHTSCTIRGIDNVRNEMWHTTKRVRIQSGCVVTCIGNWCLESGIGAVEGDLRVIAHEQNTLVAVSNSAQHIIPPTVHAYEYLFDQSNEQPEGHAVLWPVAKRKSEQRSARGQSATDTVPTVLSSNANNWPRSLCGGRGANVPQPLLKRHAVRWRSSAFTDDKKDFPRRLGVANISSITSTATQTGPAYSSYPTPVAEQGGRGGGGVLWYCPALYGEGVGTIDVSGEQGTFNARSTRSAIQYEVTIWRQDSATSGGSPSRLPVRFSQLRGGHGAPGAVRIVLTDTQALPPNLNRLVRAESPSSGWLAALSEYDGDANRVVAGSAHLIDEAYFQDRTWPLSNYHNGFVNSTTCVHRVIADPVINLGTMPNLAQVTTLTPTRPAEQPHDVKPRPLAPDEYEVASRVISGTHAAIAVYSKTTDPIAAELRNATQVLAAAVVTNEPLVVQVPLTGSLVQVKLHRQLSKLSDPVFDAVQLLDSPAVDTTPPQAGDQLERPQLPPIKNLRLVNASDDLGQRWKGLAPEFAWQPLTDQPLTTLSDSLRSGATATDLRGYSVRLQDASTQLIIDEFEVAQARVRAEDMPKKLTAREIKITVSALGNAVRASAPVSLTVSNPAPAAVTAVQVHRGWTSLTISYERPRDADWLGVSVDVLHAGAVVQHHKLIDASNFVISNLNQGAEYVIEMTSVDMFGTGGTASVAATTKRMSAKDVSDPFRQMLSDADRQFYLDTLKKGVIPGEKLESLSVAQLTAGILKAAFKIGSQGTIETDNGAHRVVIGVESDTHNGELVVAKLVDKTTGSTPFLLTAAGQLVAENAYARGDIEASSLKAGTAMVDTLHVASNAISAVATASRSDSSDCSVVVDLTNATVGSVLVVSASVASQKVTSSRLACQLRIRFRTPTGWGAYSTLSTLRQSVVAWPDSELKALRSNVQISGGTGLGGTGSSMHSHTVSGSGWVDFQTFEPIVTWRYTFGAITTVRAPSIPAGATQAQIVLADPFSSSADIENKTVTVQVGYR